MDQMLKEFRENEENIIRLEMGRNNKMARGGIPSARRLLIASPQPLTPPKLGDCSPAWQDSKEKRR